jgi:ATP-dependent phosphofructokinase / diphosphate-dependent phosphofructokinase
MAIKRIGILTGGGDVPGLNSVIKGVVYRGSEHDIEVVGIRRGWEGLTHVNLEDFASTQRYVLPLNRENTRTIDRTGGTFLHSSRTNPSKMKSVPDFLNAADYPSAEITKGGSTFTAYDLSKKVLKTLEDLRLDYLICIGGDDTLSYAARLHALGFKVIAIPKTMDNDVRNTEYCIGFSTAITRATEAIERQRTTVGSHERIGIFRVFGRDAGYTALYTAYVTSIRCCIPEYKVDLKKLIDLLVTDKRNNPSSYALVILSEGAEWEGYQVREYGEADAFGHRKKANVGEDLSEEIKKCTGEETIISDLTYDLRSGSPDFVDRMVAATFAGMAMDCIQEGKRGVMMAISAGCYTAAEIPDPALGPRHVEIGAMYNTERFRPNYADKLGLPIFLTRA